MTLKFSKHLRYKWQLIHPSQNTLHTRKKTQVDRDHGYSQQGLVGTASAMCGDASYFNLKIHKLFIFSYKGPCAHCNTVIWGKCAKFWWRTTQLIWIDGWFVSFECVRIICVEDKFNHKNIIGFINKNLYPKI